MSDTAMIMARHISTLTATVAQWRAEGLSIGLVPTMGALHEGHLTLVEAALARCDRVIASIFVNPIQFDNPDDLAQYPQTADEDAERLRDAGAHALFMPDATVMYPAGFATTVHVKGVSGELCGAFRPGHFDGVATVVTKLLLISRADRAFFGEKDFQQLQIIRRVVADLNIPVDIVGCPIKRESDMLAMSSRNRRLSPEARHTAARLPALMRAAVESFRQGDNESSTRLRAALGAEGFNPVEYATFRQEANLAPALDASTPCRLFVAAWLDGVRLIDNMPVA
ncbi:pantoate--beta-alanine ligase [Brytella acorum]|uniref:Pantothenate synthetase n=1 Tax=Brytella acorum TaxID=2959299 RepID=A0AA35UTA0_9PROT|nr:pantoate--beta-alanine ligase [Brytella acorum]MDF3625741.1 pantoate--beta-alanine ligase [Brytella acorum]CAI9121668.1 pantoate--beta-alanine ligase [Brytella acorum]